MPRPLVRQSDGLVPCNVVWELPKVAIPGSGTPTACDQVSYLSLAAGNKTSASGGAVCEVRQLPILDRDPDAAPSGEGWFYDDYSRELHRRCSKSQLHDIAFTPHARPPLGVNVELECLDETQHVANTQSNVSAALLQPEIGSPCGEVNSSQLHGDEACVVWLNNGTTDASMFCHPETKVCVRRCASDADCPPAWACDTRPETLATPGLLGAYCVNPTCDAD